MIDVICVFWFVVGFTVGTTNDNITTRVGGVGIALVSSAVLIAAYWPTGCGL